MKFLKIKLLFFFSFLSLFSLADDISPWVCNVYKYIAGYQTFPYHNTEYFSSKDEALKAVKRYVPFNVWFRSSYHASQISNRTDLASWISTSQVYQINIPWESNFYPSDLDTLCLSNIVTGENYPIKNLLLDNPYIPFIENSIVKFRQLKSNVLLLKASSIMQYSKKDNNNFSVLLDFDDFCYNVVNSFKDYDINFIKENIEYLIPYLISNLNNISNSFERVLINSDYGISLLHNIDSTVSGFPTTLEDINQNTSLGKVQALASGTIGDNVFTNPDAQAEGVLFSLYQLTRDQRGEPEKLNVTQKEAYDYLGLDKEYGSFPSINDGKRITQTLAAQVVANSAAQQEKYKNLYSISDDDGYVIDPETGEKVSLQDAFKNWNNEKANGAIASYSYNNPAATNGLLGAIKKSLTEESDWRLLDKGFKEKVEDFTQEIKDDGIKINQGGNPLRVSIAQDVPIYVDISAEQFQGITFSTDIKQPLEQFKDTFNSFFQLWSVFSGVTDKSSRSWLDLINENNSNYYDFMRDKLYSTLSNDLASIVRNTSRTNDFYNSLSNQLERIISSHTVEVASTSPFEIYANQDVSTLKHSNPHAYLLYDERYQSFEGSTNFEQAIIFMLHDQHVIAQNNLKANMMSADYIRGIYNSLSTGSNIASRVDYITNQVFSANSLSTDPDHDYSSAYASQADELKTHLDDIVTSIQEFKSQTLEKLTPIANQIFADYILPSKLTVLNFREHKFQVDLIKYRAIFDLMHYASSVGWLIIGLLMLPRVIYMLLAFSLKILGKFYNIMRNG